MILRGDLFDVLPTLPKASIDACVTDPPYELGFMGKAWDGSGVACAPETWQAVLRVMKPGAYLLAFGGTRTFHRMTCAIEDAGFEIRDCLSWLYGSGFPKSLNLADGRGTALKPAWEPIILARKPLVGTVAANVTRYGTGALNIDACRIGEDDTRRLKPATGATSFPHSDDAWEPRDTVVGSEFGRWPANVLLDEEAAALLDEQSGDRPVSGAARKGKDSLYNRAGSHDDRSTFNIVSGGDPATWPNDKGGASRFFYCAKASRSERDRGCDSLPHATAGEVTGGRAEGSAGLNSPRAGAGRTGGGRNTHPTVKPLALMRWLVRLVTPVGGTVLDPFMGSGTTGLAAAAEDRSFIGIEREVEYVAIAEARIAAVAPLFAASGE